MRSLGLAFLRLSIAAVSVAHGAHMLFGVWAGPGIGPGGLQNTATYFASIGLQPAFVVAVIAGLGQLAGGLLIAIGWLTRYTTALGLGAVGFGLWKTQWPWGFFLNWTSTPATGHGLEYSVLILGVLSCLLLTGPGEFSIDGQRAASRASRSAARQRLRKNDGH